MCIFIFCLFQPGEIERGREAAENEAWLQPPPHGILPYPFNSTYNDSSIKTTTTPPWDLFLRCRVTFHGLRAAPPRIRISSSNFVVPVMVIRHGRFLEEKRTGTFHWASECALSNYLLALVGKLNALRNWNVLILFSILKVVPINFTSIGNLREAYWSKLNFPSVRRRFPLSWLSH